MNRRSICCLPRVPACAAFTIAAGLLFLAPVACRATPVTFTYEAHVATVSGTPLGISPPLNTPVTGFFTYDTATADVNATAERGHYPHALGGGDFQAIISGFGIQIDGSPTPFVEVEDIPSGGSTIDTFRYVDGDDINRATGVMMVNGSPDADLSLFFAVTDGSGVAHPDDSLPDPFPFEWPTPGYPHTFSLSDSNGTLLLQMDMVAPVPEPAAWLLAVAGLVGVGLCLRRRRAG